MNLVDPLNIKQCVVMRHGSLLIVSIGRRCKVARFSVSYTNFHAKPKRRFSVAQPPWSIHTKNLSWVLELDRSEIDRKSNKTRNFQRTVHGMSNMSIDGRVKLNDEDSTYELTVPLRIIDLVLDLEWVLVSCGPSFLFALPTFRCSASNLANVLWINLDSD